MKTKFASLLVSALLVAVPAAQAVSFSISYAQNAGLGAGPYGAVNLTQNGSNVDVTVQLNAGYAFAKTGAVSSQAFVFNATGVVVGDITIDAHTPALDKTSGGLSAAFAGSFGFGINAPSQGPGGSDTWNAPFTFHVANATISDLTAANAAGYIFAVDLFRTDGSGATGPAAVPYVPGGQTAPDGGATVMLLGGTLAALALGRRFLKA